MTKKRDVLLAVSSAESPYELKKVSHSVQNVHPLEQFKLKNRSVIVLLINSVWKFKKVVSYCGIISWLELLFFEWESASVIGLKKASKVILYHRFLLKKGVFT